MIWSQLEERFSSRHGDTPKSTRALLEIADALARQLPGLQQGKPSRAVVLQSDPTLLLASALACWQRGFSAVVLRDSMSEAQVHSILEWIHPAVVMRGPAITSASTGDVRRQTLAPRDEALVICTSGTTGAPKLVALPAESVCINAGTIAEALGIAAHDRLAVCTPLGYMYGLVGGCLAALWAGAELNLFHPRQPPSEVHAAIRKFDLTVVQGPPSWLRLFLAYWNGKPFHQVRLLTTGGEPMEPGLRERLSEAFPCARKLFLYGMTEAGPRISHLPFDLDGGVDGRIGTPYSHIDWRLDPMEGLDGGRLVLRGPNMFLGYITPDGRHQGLDAEGFFHSNDLLRPLPRGGLRFCGRIDRVFRSGGRLVNPDDVERVIVSMPNITAATCLAEPHPVLGHVPVVQVVCEDEALWDPSALRTACLEHVEEHAVPRRFDRASMGELSESGKRLRPRAIT